MTHNLLLKISICGLLFFFFTCNTNKDLKTVSSENCQTLATVKDMTGLDGCSMMIVLDNGDKLLPAKINNEDFVLRDGQRIKLNYKELEDVMSVCMAEKASIEITCIELIEGRPIVKECVNTEDPISIPWMKEVINTSKPTTIQKFDFRDGWAYLYYFKTKQLLYDCQGTLLCKHEGLGVNQCKQRYLQGQKGKVIYRSHTGPQDK